ncbi:DIE2/ALG10 family-domain-containing protein [Nemania sp. FL0916]|nr:DIE2/ALG10 family-domain-containing protein [Nemania sp. FL0916]
MSTRTPPAFIELLLVGSLASIWLLAVNANVPEPYLDEVFHIPQAQTYCEGRYLEWDDKITTPPGLYILTIAFDRLFRLSCSTNSLRSFNVAVVSCIAVLVLACRPSRPRTSAKSDSDGQISAQNVRIGMNVALFPVLFFFSGLYYTDPASTLIVLLAYAHHLRARIGPEQPSFFNDVYTFGLGVVALGFRQTNIFWVVVYLGGLEVIQTLKALNPEPVETPKFEAISDQIKFYAWRYSLGEIHDPSLSFAQPVDILVCVISIGVAALCNLPTVLRRFIWPYGAILAAFAAFVAWNGGVVLGDKSNHVATLHLAQMLYIWPFFVFFSAPLFIPQLLNRALVLFPRRSQRRYTRLSHRGFSGHVAITALVCHGAIAVALLIVRFNTIIHPFTLADNRHYVFYVFRYSILRAWWIRYALAPVYVVCAWFCWGALQSVDDVSNPATEKWIQSPFVVASSPPAPAVESSTGEKPSTKSLGTSKAKAEIESEPKSPPTSTVLMWLLATTLSLMTAPLVEPRYFILPWVFWRLLVPETDIPTAVSDDDRQSKPSGQSTERSISGYMLILLLEKSWFIHLNVVTMCIFIMQPFYWRAPDGTLLDGGREQRFMW